MKAKMNEEKKMKMVYTIELLIFAVAFLVITLLEFTKVLTISVTHLRIINWISVFAAPIGIVDVIWCLCSTNRRKKNSILDKLLILPLTIYVLVFDIICFINYETPLTDLAQVMIPTALSYVTLIYVIEAIYHYYHPVPMLLMEIEKEKQKQAEEVIDVPVNEDDNKIDKQD